MALRRPTVAVLAIFLVLGSGVMAYRSLQVELFPQIDFPLVTVFVAYPSADPEAVVRFVTEPVERPSPTLRASKRSNRPRPRAPPPSSPLSAMEPTWQRPRPPSRPR